MSETNEATPADSGIFTLDQYLAMVDAAASKNCTDDDNASVETNRSTGEATSSKGGAGGSSEEARDAEADPTLLSLAHDQLLEMLAFLTLPNRARLSMTCHRQHALRSELDGRIRSLSVDRDEIDRLIAGPPPGAVITMLQNMGGRMKVAARVAVEILRDSHVGREIVASADAHKISRFLQWSRLSGLRLLDVGKYATDEWLDILTDGRAELGGFLLPSLEVLMIVGSHKVHETSFLELGAENDFGQKRTNLREIDATFCDEITYGAALKLRQALPQCLVRRLPSWVCGHTETPFAGRSIRDVAELSGNEAEEVEVHSYWPDGSFSYGRSVQSEGFVVRIQMIDNDPNHLEEKLQFSDFEPPEGWPEWTRFAFRPGVSLLRVPDETESDGNITRSILVAQRIGGIKHPRYFPKREHADMVPLGQSRFFALNGALRIGEQVDAATNSNSIMVSQMKKSPLSKDEETPPADLVDGNAAFLSTYEAEGGTVPPYGEELLHRGLAGPNLEILQEEVNFSYSNGDLA